LRELGAPMTAQQLTDVLTKTTLSTVGVAVSPHLFRTSAASTVATYGGDNPYPGSALLHHTDPSVTVTHYNRATAFSAGENFRRVVRRYERTGN
jgi:integrase